MRGLLVCAVVAALAAPVLAGVSNHTGILDIRTPGAVLVGNHWEYDVGPGGTMAAPFYVDIDASCTHPEGMCSFELRLTGPEGMAYAASAKGGKNYCGYYPMAEGRGTVDHGWDQPNSVSWNAGTMPAPGSPFNMYPMIGTINQGLGYDVYWGVNGWAAWIKITSPVPAGSIIGGINQGIGDANFDGLLESNITVRPLWIVPEPVSALMLLAGLPLLRRRR